MLFIGFFLPTNNDFYLPIGPLLLSLSELAFIALPVLNVLSKPEGKVLRVNSKIELFALLLISVIILSDLVFKVIIYGQGLGEGVRSLRMGLPLLSSILLLFQGLRPSIEKIWSVMMAAIGGSIIISFCSLFLPIPLYYGVQSSADILAETQGRLVNSNASFGVIGLYILFRRNRSWYATRRWFRLVMVFSGISLIATFNRTYLALLAIELIFLLRGSFTLTLIYRFLIINALIGVTFIGLYRYFPIIERQVDRRIISIVTQETSIYQSTIESNRDKIYNGIISRINEGYWMFGLPFDKNIFVKKSRSGIKAMKFTDTSLANMLLRYGILSFIFYLLLLRGIYNDKYGVRFVLIIYLIASLNIDSLLSHNSVFFLVIFMFLNTSVSKNVVNKIDEV